MNEPYRRWDAHPRVSLANLGIAVAGWCLLGTLLLSPEAQGQGASGPRNALSLELAGNGLGVGASHEWAVPLNERGAQSLRVRVGFGLVPDGLDYHGGSSEALPLTLSYTYSFLELGAGVTLSTIDHNGAIPQATVAMRFEWGQALVRPSVSFMRVRDARTESCGHYDAGCITEVWPVPGLSVGLTY